MDRDLTIRGYADGTRYSYLKAFAMFFRHCDLSAEQFTIKHVNQYQIYVIRKRRFGAVGRSNSIGTMERFWRSMKCEYARWLILYRPIRPIVSQLALYAACHNRERPYQELGVRTPDEVHSTGVKYDRA